MAPLIVMLAAWLVARSAGTAGLWLQADSWTGALRIALAAMFVFTALSHFHPRTRADLIRMVPASLPAPALLVSATGVLELLGAVGLMVPRALPAAAYGLMALLCGNAPCERPRRTGGADDRRSPRGAACLAPSAAAVLDRRPVVGAGPLLKSRCLKPRRWRGRWPLSRRLSRRSGDAASSSKRYRPAWKL